MSVPFPVLTCVSVGPVPALQVCEFHVINDDCHPLGASIHEVGSNNLLTGFWNDTSQVT